MPRVLTLTLLMFVLGGVAGCGTEDSTPPTSAPAGAVESLTETTPMPEKESTEQSIEQSLLPGISLRFRDAHADAVAFDETQGDTWQQGLFN